MASWIQLLESYGDWRLLKMYLGKVFAFEMEGYGFLNVGCQFVEGRRLGHMMRFKS